VNALLKEADAGQSVAALAVSIMISTLT